MPPGMSRDQIIKRYDDNCGFPTDKMVTEMKAACTKIENMKTYDDWFKVRKSIIITYFREYCFILISEADRHFTSITELANLNCPSKSE